MVVVLEIPTHVQVPSGMREETEPMLSGVSPWEGLLLSAQRTNTDCRIEKKGIESILVLWGNVEKGSGILFAKYSFFSLLG